MESLENLKFVLEANRRVLQRVRELNMRAGREVFPLLPTDELRALVLQCLNGARCASEIRNVECLRLPQLDEAQEARVLLDSPDTIVVLGKERTVEYRARMSPRVTIEISEVRDGYIWKDLPEGCICLPDGRQVELRFTWDYWTSFSGFDTSQLKDQLKEKVNEDQWAKFTDKPAIALPDPVDPASHVQRVKAVQYGKCVVTGEPLMAYGVASVNYGHYYATDTHFKVEWLRDEQDAQSMHDSAVRHLDEVRIRESAKIEKQARLRTAQEIQEQVKSLTHLGSALPKNLSDRLQEMAYHWLTEEVSESWIMKAKQLIVQVEAAVKKLDEERAAEQKARELAEARNMEIYGITGHLLETARAMAERAIERHGREAEEIFMEELTAPYGKDRRQNAIHGRLGNGGATSNFYSLSRARDVDAVLEAAITLVNEQRVAVAQKAAKSTKPQTPADPKNFDMGKLFGGVAKEAKKRGGKKSSKSR